MEERDQENPESTSEELDSFDQSLNSEFSNQIALDSNPIHFGKVQDCQYQNQNLIEIQLARRKTATILFEKKSMKRVKIRLPGVNCCACCLRSRWSSCSALNQATTPAVNIPLFSLPPRVHFQMKIKLDSQNIRHSNG